MTNEPPPGDDARWWFIYYRVRRADLGRVVGAVREAQRGLCARLPGLTATLMQRPSSDEAEVTLLETYGAPPAWPAERLADAPATIDATVAPAVAPWLRGPRHLEAFSPCA
jgi:hypothetical protein